jgi:tetratricopeptide (TPR) repeat protein
MRPIDSYQIITPSTELGEKQKYLLIKALECFCLTLRKEPADVECYCNRASTKIKLLDYHGAIEDCDTALRFNLACAQAYNIRGIAKAGLKDFNVALGDFDMAIAMNSNYGEVHYNKGYVLFEIQDYENAIVCFTKAIAFFPYYAPAYLFRGVSRNILKKDSGDDDEERASELFEK